MSDLKPCPFCASPDIGWWGDVPYCGRCDAMGPTQGQDDTRENMAQAWNRRAESDLLQMLHECAEYIAALNGEQDDYCQRVRALIARATGEVK